MQDNGKRRQDNRERMQGNRARMRDSGKEPENGKKRIQELDYYKGFLIYLVVLGHFLLPLKGSPHSLFGRSFYLIYSFSAKYCNPLQRNCVTRIPFTP